jgi:O-antigen/teichoic acid export membrane protein
VWPNRTEIIKWRYELSGFSLIHSSNTFGWLILSFIAVSFNYIFGTLLTANGNLKPMNILATFAVLINITSNLILIPKYGSTGAAFSSMITQFLTLIFQIYLCFKFFSFKVQRSSNLRLLSFIVLFIMSTWLIDTNLDFIWILKILTYGSIGIVIGFGLKLIEIKELKAFIKMAKN